MYYITISCIIDAWELFPVRYLQQHGTSSDQIGFVVPKDDCCSETYEKTIFRLF